MPLRQLRGLRRAIRGFASLGASHSLRLHYYPSRAPQQLISRLQKIANMANVWVMYDIRRDRNRSRIAKFCKRIGLHRVQKSIFFGQLPKKMIRRMAKEMNRGINTQTDNLVILTVPPKTLNEAIRLGNSPDFVAKANDRTPKFF